MNHKSVSDEFLLQEQLNTDKSAKDLYQESDHRRNLYKTIESSAFIIYGLVVLIIAIAFFTSQNILLRIKRENEIRNTSFIQLDMGKYSGQTDFGYFNGDGSFKFEDGSQIIGSWVDNVLTGHGEEIIPQKGKYSGHYKNSKRDGEGIFQWNSGATYSGEWKNDQLNGTGEYTDGQGTSYSGEFLDNSFDSGMCQFTNEFGEYELTYQDGNVVSAEIIFADGSVYSGDANNKTIDGSGKLQFATGDLYVGSFVDGVRDGKGVYTWKSGDQYDGEWENDSMSGSGIYNYADGSVLNGEFQSNAFEDGSLHTENEFGTYDFSFKDGAPVSVEIVLTDGTTYEGDMDEQGLNGSAQIKYSNGDTYSGEVTNGMKNGNGKYTWENGANYDGSWFSDVMQGKGTYKYTKDEDGYALTGNFSNGLPDGDCTYYTSTTISYKTTWQNGTCIKVEE